MSRRFRVFSLILIMILSLSTTVLGLSSYDQYYNSDYSYSLRIPHESSSKVIETNRAVVIIPYTNQMRLQINVDDVSNLISNDDKEGVKLKKLTLKSPVFEKTYGSFDYVKKNAQDIVSDFETDSTVTKVEEISVDHSKAFQITYDTRLVKADGSTGKGHGLLIFTVNNGYSFYFIFTDNKLKEKNILDYDSVQKAISTIDLEDVDYKPFFFIGIFCLVLWLLLMSLYLKAERMARSRRDRRRREKTLSKRREEGLEMIGQDDDFEYYDQILLEDADDDESGDNIYTIEQIMEMYPSLKKVKIRPKGSGEAIVTENKNVIDYNKLGEEKEKENSETTLNLEEDDRPKPDPGNPWGERADEIEPQFVFEDVSDEISEETRKEQEKLDLSFNSENKNEYENVREQDYGKDVIKEEEESESLGYAFDDEKSAHDRNDTLTIKNNELYEEMMKTQTEEDNGDK